MIQIPTILREIASFGGSLYEKGPPPIAVLQMYGKNNDDANEIVELLIGDYGCQLEHVPVSGHSFYDAFLVQISRDRNKYKNE